MTVKPISHSWPSLAAPQVHRERSEKPHSWSVDWPFAGRRSASGPSETFESGGRLPKSERPLAPMALTPR